MSLALLLKLKCHAIANLWERPYNLRNILFKHMYKTITCNRDPKLGKSDVILWVHPSNFMEMNPK